jgi:hypothetical protein
MADEVHGAAGLTRALDHFQERVVAYRKLLSSLSRREQDDQRPDIELVAITEGEVETLEALIVAFAQRVTGAAPDPKVWGPLHPYCSRNKESKEGWAEQEHEYFRWALLWIQKTRTYIAYLAGGPSAASQVQRPDRPVMPPAPEGAKEYDVALSFAGEDRLHARRIAELLRAQEFTVFYDEYEQAKLWGRNLYTHLSEIYQNKARYCLMFVSVHYAQKWWTKREREAAQARAFRESEAYILPVRLDDTTIPGVEDTIAYVDLRTTSAEEVVKLLAAKLQQEAND